ncbi:hypothetical protein INR49_011856 [Caranx melampygus]|nr:hypothetical protein INR49_011856 [Caranx melampygus]
MKLRAAIAALPSLPRETLKVARSTPTIIRNFRSQNSRKRCDDEMWEMQFDGCENPRLCRREWLAR